MATGTGTIPSSLTINGQAYVPGTAALQRVDAAGRPVVGSFMRDRCGIRLYGLDGQPFAYVKLDRTESWFVSCSRVEGRVRYMFALSDPDARRLGFNPSAADAYRQEHEAAADVRRQVLAAERACAA
ncbi:hypothetical protein RHOFW510R12_00425 [Rhodanobacter sp. FW510-R12]|uniref:hypothetical protein n=1 Tax=Rhodanobacter thiooxydans TaxID=416169 RepID=UPI0009172AEB|nr:hypothetical protein [Rhodanobacter thiooxydans]UJJ56706.1 hypothetical protein LRK53_19040 [Rhodanobacter thiooxydans]